MCSAPPADPRSERGQGVRVRGGWEKDELSGIKREAGVHGVEKAGVHGVVKD